MNRYSVESKDDGCFSLKMTKEIYQKGNLFFENKCYLRALEEYKKIEYFKDVKEKILECMEETYKHNAIDNVKLINNFDLMKHIYQLSQISDYEDSEQYIENYKQQIKRNNSFTVIFLLFIIITFICMLLIMIL